MKLIEINHSVKLESNFCLKTLIRRSKYESDSYEQFKDLYCFTFKDKSELHIVGCLIEIDNTNVK